MITVIKSPFVQYKLTILRNKKTSNTVFRQTMNEISYLIASDVLQYVPFKKQTIETPLKKMSGTALGQPIILVPILRAGLGLLEGFAKFLPEAEKGHIGLYRDEQTYEPVEYLFKLPRVKNKKVLILDPMLATGNSAVAAVQRIKDAGAKRIKFVCLLAAPEGLAAFSEQHPDVPIVTAAVDRELNDHAYILPGLGDAGDRMYGTK